ncbi:GDP-L-fucose synthase [Paenibacillus sp. UNC496MF]|uniref:GDP-L-fucose synthase family protein n=1 Tax=Paenibacillus sp. UNC496MF TaxID=1502753 RepID=UPI0008E0B765|nr:GDP-L-fucose synthase [Paenibacillus sp. UNC496MF]SFI88230.1 GDP-L-fucose synthase [Paenibacillus sp. UNC496MF]
MQKDSVIYVSGHKGLVGSSIVRALDRQGFTNVIYRTSSELDLRDAAQVEEFFRQHAIEYVFCAAAKVGGIVANDTYPADFIRDNLIIQTNLIDASYRHQVSKLLFLGSTCIYPRLAPQPLKEEYLLTGELEETNKPYAVAKIAGITMCQSYNRQYGTRFISAMPTNLYGPNDNFHPQNSHVLPSLLRKFHEARVEGKPFVDVWGSGTPLREFLHCDDLAEACLYLMEHYEGNDIVNIGVGQDISIRELAELIGDIVGYEGEIRFDASKPDGTPRKLVDVTRINQLGWQSRISLREGIQWTYEWFLQSQQQLQYR